MGTYRPKFITIFVVVFFSFCLINSPASPCRQAMAGWQLDYVANDVYSENGYGGHTSLAFNPLSGYPAIAYLNDMDYSLVFAQFNGSTWDVTLMDVLDFTGFGSNGCSLAFDPVSGYPAISYSYLYFDIAASDFISSLRYAYFDGSTWNMIPIDSSGDVGRYSSLAFDSVGYPAISYYDATNDKLKYARYFGPFLGWLYTTIDSGPGVGKYTSIAFDPSDNPAISYYYNDGTDINLIYAYYNGTTWDLTPVDSFGVVDIGKYSSLAFDPLGNPAISYYNDSSDDLMFAQFNGATWDITPVDTIGSVGMYTSLAFDPSDNPAISYYDATNGDLKLARLISGTWWFAAVDPGGAGFFAGFDTSLAFDFSGYPAISYLDTIPPDIEGNLKFASLAPDATTTTTTTTTTTPTTTTTTTTTTTLPPELCASPASLSFCLKKGLIDCKLLNIWNCGGGTLQWQVNEPCPWLTLQPVLGDSTGETDQVNVCVDTSSLKRGKKYNCKITVTSNGGTQEINVYLTVKN